MFTAGYSELQPLLGEGLQKEEVATDPEKTAIGIAALGISQAADFLVRGYTLVATNVPYLTRSKQGEVLRDYCDERFPMAK